MTLQSLTKPLAIAGLLFLALAVGRVIVSRFDDGDAEFKKSSDRIRQSLCKIDPALPKCKE